jgi:hypothetical protein
LMLGMGRAVPWLLNAIAIVLPYILYAWGVVLIVAGLFAWLRFGNQKNE